MLPSDDQIATLEQLLRKWARWCRSWSGPELGYPRGCVWAHSYAARHPVTETERDEGLDSWEVRALDAAIGDLERPARLMLEMRWLAFQRIPQTDLEPAYALLIRGLQKRNVLI